MQLERRELIQWLAATAGLKCLEAVAPADLLAFGRDAHRRASGLRALSRRQARTVAAAAELIIPRTETPGATDAGVTAFIDHLLANWHTPQERDRFLAGIRELEAAHFAEARAPDQIAALTALDDQVEALRAERGTAANEHWFAMLKFLTVYGYCTSQVGMRALGLHQLPSRFDGCAAIDG